MQVRVMMKKSKAKTKTKTKNEAPVTKMKTMSSVMAPMTKK